MPSQDNEDFTDEEKAKDCPAVLVSHFAYIAKSREGLCEATSTSFHRPLLLAHW